MFVVTDYLTLIETAERTGTSKVTARRYLDAGKFPNAKREDGRADGRWLIPWEDVVSSGLARKKAAGNFGDGAVGASETLQRSLEILSRTVEVQAQTIDRLTALVEQMNRLGGGDPRGT